MSVRKSKPHSQNRREFLTQAAAAPALIAAVSTFARSSSPAANTIASPNGRVQFHFSAEPDRLRYFMSLDGRKVIHSSILSASIDGVDITGGASLGKIERYRIQETYPTRGVHSKAINNCRGARISIQHPNGNYILEVRVFNDGIAFRFVIPGTGRRVPDEASTFAIPAGSTVWFHDFEGHYEGIHKQRLIEDVKEGDWVAPPLTIKLPNGSGF